MTDDNVIPIGDPAMTAEEFTDEILKPLVDKAQDTVDAGGGNQYDLPLAFFGHFKCILFIQGGPKRVAEFDDFANGAIGAINVIEDKKPK